MTNGALRRLVIGGIVGSVVLSGLMTVTASASVPHVVITDAFSAVTPTRILDTRTGLGEGGTPAKVGAGQSLTLHVAGVAGVASNVDAVVMNVTAVAPSVATYVSVYPADLSSPPTVSNINVAARRVVPNLVTVQVDGAGDVKLYNSAGTVDLLADVTGFYSGGASDSYYPIAPARILDTRDGTGLPGGPQVVGPGGTIDLSITDFPGIAVNADAVVLNVTAVGATRSTYIQVYPKPSAVGAPPVVSNLNVLPGQAVANLVTVGIGSGGDVRFRNAVGNVDVIADVAGYFAPDNGGSLYTPVTPTRLLDTRGVSPVGPGGAIDLQMTGNQGMPLDATAALFNYTAIAPTAATYVQAYPSVDSSLAFPATSNLNLSLGEVRANLASVMLGAGGDVRLRNQAGITNMLVDLAGYYTSATNPNPVTPQPAGGPGAPGVVVTGTFINLHPSPYGKASLNVSTNVDTSPLVATAIFRAGAVKITSTSVVGTPTLFTFGLGNAPVGVPVPVVLSAKSAALGATATATVIFVPAALTCRAAANPTSPAQHAVVDIVVGTAPGADVSAIFHFKATTPTQNSHADKTGRADIMRNIGGATVGFRVPVTITVVLGPTHATCSTTFTPVA